MKPSIGLCIHQLSRLWRSVLDQELATLGLTQTTGVALVYIHAEGEGIAQTELARILAVEHPSLVRTLDQLVKLELIERRACQNDRRSKRLFLTEKGKALVEPVNTVRERCQLQVMQGLSEDQAAQFQHTLNLLQSNALALTERSKNPT
ncbi:transcriptional regulator SlyA [Pokkaliibacter sp. MBI-7]|uniref:transcriptional regulator SlyA n=1 Tax=Pokkaliibacter sp. MBI-7 TaxID=3040600 RepID=UPI00244860B1|nr:transcriptional regulator SlyA [Pokkaliibacter sp. MBI-7]MDH2436120.1 transcriptional regulator SlyA [Pokkaliibacter sp. MBI-7]